MDKKTLEQKLSKQLENGFVPGDVQRIAGMGPIRVLDRDEAEPDRIVIGFRTQEKGGRIHQHQYFYELTEVVDMLKSLEEARHKA
jgi:hypothetical protein